MQKTRPPSASKRTRNASAAAAPAAAASTEPPTTPLAVREAGTFSSPFTQLLVDVAIDDARLDDATCTVTANASARRHTSTIMHAHACIGATTHATGPAGVLTLVFHPRTSAADRWLFRVYREGAASETRSRATMTWDSFATCTSGDLDRLLAAPPSAALRLPLQTFTLGSVRATGGSLRMQLHGVARTASERTSIELLDATPPSDAAAAEYADSGAAWRLRPLTAVVRDFSRDAVRLELGVVPLAVYACYLPPSLAQRPTTASFWRRALSFALWFARVSPADFAATPLRYPEVLGQVVGFYALSAAYARDLSSVDGSLTEQVSELRTCPRQDLAAGDCEDSAREIAVALYDLRLHFAAAGQPAWLAPLNTLAQEYRALLLEMIAKPQARSATAARLGTSHLDDDMTSTLRRMAEECTAEKAVLHHTCALVPVATLERWQMRGRGEAYEQRDEAPALPVMMTEPTRWSRLVADGRDSSFASLVDACVTKFAAKADKAAADAAIAAEDHVVANARLQLATACTEVGIDDVSPGFQQVVISACVFGDTSFEHHLFSLDGETYGVHATALLRRREQVRLVHNSGLVDEAKTRAAAAVAQRPHLPPLDSTPCVTTPAPTAVLDSSVLVPFVSGPLGAEDVVVRLWAHAHGAEDTHAAFALACSGLERQFALINAEVVARSTRPLEVVRGLHTFVIAVRQRAR